MDTIKIDKKQAQLIAHRGLSMIEVENTNAAFIAAGNRSYYGIETDVYKCADGRYVISHDRSTNRMTHGAVDIDIEKNSYELIKDVLIPGYNGDMTRKDRRFPLLQEYLQICKKYEKKCVLELKSAFSKADLKEIIGLINREYTIEAVTFISFSLNNCILAREILPKQPVQWLVGEEMDEEKKNALYQYHLDLDIHYPYLNKELVDELHANNVLVNCWTCDKKESAEKLIEMGVDFITTNVLE